MIKKIKLNRRDAAFMIMVLWGVFAGLLAWHCEEERKDSDLTISQMELSLDAAKAGRWYWDIEENALYWDERQMKIFTEDEQAFDPSYNGFISRVHPEDVDRVNTAIENSTSTGAPYAITYRLGFLRDGEYPLIRAYGTRSKDGKALAGICINLSSLNSCCAMK